jgi:hypothetical protein
MSLFQSKTWWKTTCGSGEEFDQKHFCPFRANNETLLLTASYSGNLRLFRPQKGDYLSSHLLLEQSFPDPILQVVTGRFSALETDQCIAILFLKSYSVYQYFSDPP